MQKLPYPLLVLFIILLALLFFYFPISKQVNHEQIKNIKDLPKEYNLESIYSGLKFTCQPADFNCISDTLEQLTHTVGPQAAIAVLGRLQKMGKVEKQVDDHQLAHHIGRQTAATFGIDAKAFLFCPMADYNGGCQHGFFEHVLGKTKTAKEAAESICESLGDDFSSKDKFYCYHGVGHGVMMAKAYDLTASLDTCNSLSLGMGQDGCWQGVFMENVNTALRGEARQGVFSETDPLSPCTNMEEKYQHECLINHAGWLMKYFKNDVSLATNACLKAIKVSSCLQSIGLMVTNPSWQSNLLRDKSDDLELNAWRICQKFPQEKVGECIIGAVDNIANFNQFDIAKSSRFCHLVSKEYQILCFQIIGKNLRNQAVNVQKIPQICQSLEENFAKECLRSAGLL